MTTYQRFSRLRKDSGISQERLAEMMNVSRQTVSRWETGASIPSAENLARLSQLFQVPMEALLRDDWVPPEEPPEVPAAESPAEISVPVEVPVSRPQRRLLVLTAAAALAVGILIGALFFRTPSKKSAPIAETKSEVIDPSMLNDPIELLVPYD